MTIHCLWHWCADSCYNFTIFNSYFIFILYYNILILFFILTRIMGSRIGQDKIPRNKIWFISSCLYHGSTENIRSRPRSQDLFRSICFHVGVSSLTGVSSLMLQDGKNMKPPACILFGNPRKHVSLSHLFCFTHRSDWSMSQSTRFFISYSYRLQITQVGLRVSCVSAAMNAISQRDSLGRVNANWKRKQNTVAAQNADARDVTTALDPTTSSSSGALSGLFGGCPLMILCWYWR